MEENTNNFDDEKTLVLKIKELEDLCVKLSINNQNSRNISLTHLILNSENFEIKLKELEIKNQILKNHYKKLKEKIDNKLTEEKNIKTLIQLKKNSNFKQYFELLEKLDMKSNQTKKTQSSQSMTQITNNFLFYNKNNIYLISFKLAFNSSIPLSNSKYFSSIFFLIS